MVTSSSNLLNDTQYQVLPSQNPGLELTMLSGDPLHCVFPVALPEGEKTLSVCRLRLFLPEWEKQGAMLVHRKTGGLQESLYRGHLQLLLVSVQ